MKLSKIILENKKYIARVQIDLTQEEVKQLSETISNKLNDYLDIENKDMLQKTVASAINELLTPESL